MNIKGWLFREKKQQEPVELPIKKEEFVMKNWVRTESGDMLHMSTLKKVYFKNVNDRIIVYAKDDDNDHRILNSFDPVEQDRCKQYLDDIYGCLVNIGV